VEVPKNASLDHVIAAGDVIHAEHEIARLERKATLANAFLEGAHKHLEQAQARLAKHEARHAERVAAFERVPAEHRTGVYGE
jgi:hypothetical protein